MKINVRIDSQIKGAEGLDEHISGIVAHALNRFSDRISGVEVHLKDLNGHKGGGSDKDCMMEAHLNGQQPTAVSDSAPTFEQAIKGAAAKLKRSVESSVGREGTLSGRRDQQ
ncbi:MAG: HPF/RaiA family ribosome-associated protein [Hyphomicrobiaceae bacterium]